MNQLTGIWHTSFTVGDLNRSLAFYVDLLGLELVHRQTQDNEYTRKLVGHADARLDVAMLRIPETHTGPSGHHLELVQYLSPPADPLPTGTVPRGAAHFAFVVGNLIEAHRELVSSGVSFVSEPVAIQEGRNRGGYSVYFRDPDGITLEMVQPPEEVTA